MNPRTSEFGKAYFAETKGPPTLSGRVAWVHLEPGPVLWRKHLRPSYKSLINWGRNNFKISYVDVQHPDYDLYDEYHIFHTLTAGRETRSERSWRMCFEEIISGKGALIIARLHPSENAPMAAGSLFIDGSDISVYWSAVYDRRLQDKFPLGHYCLWHGLELARARGMKWMELGSLPWNNPVDGNNPNDKEQSIAFFKLGFATHITEDGTATPWPEIEEGQ